MAGLFVTLEGGEGAGKTTLAQRLTERLIGDGERVTRTREPGGSPGADAIRALLVSGEAGRWSALSETLLLAAARNDHLERTIRPALARGEIVLCDRYLDSTRAYQVAGRGLPAQTLATLEALIGAQTPDLTLILDIAPELGLKRSRGAALGEDRYERMDPAFHARVRDAFLAIAKAEPQRCVTLDAGVGPDALFAQAYQAIAARRAPS